MFRLSEKKQYSAMFILYFISLSLVLIVQYLLSKKHSFISGLTKYTRGCLYSCSQNISKFLISTRGINYYLTSKKYHPSNDDNCLVSVWAFAHVVLYIFVGFFCPNLFVPSLLVGIFYEIMECIFYKCHDVLDIFFNSLGFGIGFQINKLFIKDENDFKTSIFYFVGIWCVLFLFMANQVKKTQEALRNKSKVKTY